MRVLGCGENLRSSSAISGGKGETVKTVKTVSTEQSSNKGKNKDTKKLVAC